MKPQPLLLIIVALLCCCVADEGDKITSLGKIADESIVYAWWSVKAEDRIYLGLGTVDGTSFAEFHPPNRLEILLTGEDFSQREAAVWDGEEILIFGGSVFENGKYSPTEQILSFNPKLERIRVLNASLPYPTSDVAAVWGDGRVYIFLNNSERCEVYAFYPSNESFVKLDVFCPIEHPGGCVHSVVWYGGKAYFFCGEGVASFDPMSGFKWIAFTDRVWVRAVTVADGYIFAIGGSSGIAETKDEIIRFNPKTGELCEMKTKLPVARGQAVAVGGEYIYIFGGYTKDGYANEILRYDYRGDECVNFIQLLNDDVKKYRPNNGKQ